MHDRNGLTESDWCYEGNNILLDPVLTYNIYQEKERSNNKAMLTNLMKVEDSHSCNVNFQMYSESIHKSVKN